MSLASWKEQFYPVRASEATGSWLEAAEHSLRKWSGLTEENLAAHEMGKRVDEIKDASGDLLLINDTSCALCLRDDMQKAWCKSCLFVAANGYTCSSEYDAFIDDGDPLPMIACLEKTVEHCKAEVTK